jgi:hypothetical protein
MRKKPCGSFLIMLFLLFSISCIDKDVYQGNIDGNQNPEYVPYLYPYGNEAQHVVAEITLEMDDGIDVKNIEAEIPFLKYNKSWLFMLTQDDCKHAAYSTTWAAINGKPLSYNYYYLKISFEIPNSS